MSTLPGKAQSTYAIALTALHAALNCMGWSGIVWGGWIAKQVIMDLSATISAAVLNTHTARNQSNLHLAELTKRITFATSHGKSWCTGTTRKRCTICAQFVYIAYHGLYSRVGTVSCKGVGDRVVGVVHQQVGS